MVLNYAHLLVFGEGYIVLAFGLGVGTVEVERGATNRPRRSRRRPRCSIFNGPPGLGPPGSSERNNVEMGKESSAPRGHWY